MMLRLILTLIVIAVPLLAQDVPPPAKELARFDRLLGTWEGQGTSRMTADGDEMTWTGRSTVRKVLGGHFFREDTRIDLPGPFPATMGFISHMGWDPGEKRYANYSVSSLGEVTSQELVWLDSDTLMVTAMKKEHGEPTIERGVTHYKGDTQEFVVEKAVGSEPFFVYVKGTMKRVPEAKAVDLSKVGASFGHFIAEMEKLNRMAGRYEMSGSYRMGHGQEMKGFTGQYHVKPLFGGLILEGVESDSDGYEAWAGMGWDPVRERYIFVELNSWGMANTAEAWWGDDHHLVCMVGCMWMGKHLRGRGIYELDDKGHVTKAWGHMLMDAQEPFKSFEATYTLQKEGTKEMK